MTSFRKALALAFFFAAVSAFASFLAAAPWIETPWRRTLLGVASFACFGLLLGGIFAFDPESDLKITSSAIGRIAFGVAASLLLAAMWRWPADAVVLAGLSGAALGYFGMSWAKYAQF